MEVKSKKPSKQRKRRREAKLHEKTKMLKVNLTKKLRASVKKRNVAVRKEDTVKVMRGKLKGKEGKVARVSRDKMKVYIKGITRKKANGTEIMVPFQPSNLMITDLNREDGRRFKRG